MERQLFTRDAIRLIHRVSGGVPRLINILCDRSLLGAYVTGNPLVTKPIVKRAAREVKGSQRKRHGFDFRRVAMITAALLLAVAIGWIAGSWFQVAPPSVPAFLTCWLPSSWQTGTAGEVDGFTEDLPLAEEALDKASAMRVLLRRWGVELKELGRGDPCDRVMDYGLRCESDQGGWSRMRSFNRPALVALLTEDLSEQYLVIGALDAESVTLDLDAGNRRVSLASLDDDWNGDYLMVWQSPPVSDAIIGPNSRGESVRWLRKLLSQVPELAFETTGSGTFDQALDETVRRFQKQEGLKIDGVAGPKPLIRLHDAVGMPEIPKLTPTP